MRGINIGYQNGVHKTKVSNLKILCCCHDLFFNKIRNISIKKQTNHKIFSCYFSFLFFYFLLFKIFFLQSSKMNFTKKKDYKSYKQGSNSYNGKRYPSNFNNKYSNSSSSSWTSINRPQKKDGGENLEENPQKTSQKWASNSNKWSNNNQFTNKKNYENPYYNNPKNSQKQNSFSSSSSGYPTPPPFKKQKRGLIDRKEDKKANQMDNDDDEISYFESNSNDSYDMSRKSFSSLNSSVIKIKIFF